MLDGPSAVLALVLLSASVLPSQPIPYESLAATVPPAAADAAPEAAPADEAPGTETRDPDYRMRATLYHQGGGGAGG
ncbi:MAG TPA: hypothetical protein VGB49_09610, partial [Caulobacteraceae bacterium]